MSISYNARVVYGFKLNIKEIANEVTKYNVDTGEPYLTKGDSYEIATVESTEDEKIVMSTKENPDVLYDGDEFEGMEIFESGYEEGTKILGISVCGVR